ncbi:hypothetical protein GCM10009804_47610 [Kribbella hippodromi]|uniref:DUF3068 domain-containing protein n=1 Tax=Kribbella hippodromi TaxID=434347 RepID=A0ABN2DWI4_9ACTN
MVLWVLVAALVLVIGIPAGIYGYKKLTGDDATAAPHGKTIEPGQPVTAASLAEVDPATFFEGVAKRQMTQPLARLKVAYFPDQQKFLSRTDLWLTTDSAIDHKTDKFYLATTARHGAADDEPTNAICKDGKSYSWGNYAKKWQVVPFDSPECRKKPYTYTGDGLFSSGLTADQADKVLAKLRDYTGYVNPEQPTLLSAGGHTYVRQVVDFKPVKLAHDEDGGSAISMWAFKESGNDPVSWPWSNPWPLSTGVHAVYYLDTKTLLPVAAFEKGINPPSGSTEGPGVQVVNYAYPKTLPVPVFNNSPQTLSMVLPQGWKLQ